MADGLRAFAEIRIHGAQPWRLVDRCAREGIVLRDAREIDAFTLTARIPLRERERVEVLAGRCGCTLELVRESFVPRLQKKLRRRAGVLLALLLSAGALAISSLFVWDVEVVENDSTIPNEQIVRVLASHGVGFGSFWPAFRGERIRTKALLALPELSFLAVNVRGSRALVEARAAVPEPEIFDPRERQNVTAARSGVIASASAFSGELRTARGEAVTQGQILIEGTDSAPHAAGEIRAYTYYEITAAAPLTTTHKTAMGRPRHRFSLIFGKKRIFFYRNSRIPSAECDKITRVWNLSIKGLFTLPVRMEMQTIRPCQWQTQRVPLETLETEMQRALLAHLHSRLRPDSEVLAEHWSRSENDALCYVTLRAECLERIDEPDRSTKTETPVKGETVWIGS